MKTLSLIGASLLIWMANAQADPILLGSFGNWTLSRDLDSGSPGLGQSPYNPYCTIIDTSVAASSIASMHQQIMIADDKHHQFDFVFFIQLGTLPKNIYPATFAFSNGTISNLDMTYTNPMFDAPISDKNSRIAFLTNLLQSDQVTLTIPGAVRSSFYLGDSIIALKALASCIAGLPS